MKYSNEQMAHMAITSDPYTIRDRLYFIAWCWNKEKPDLKLKDIYKFLLTHSDPFTLERARERFLEHHPIWKEKYKTTDYLKKELLQNQPNLFNEEVKNES